MVSSSNPVPGSPVTSLPTVLVQSSAAVSERVLAVGLSVWPDGRNGIGTSWQARVQPCVVVLRAFRPCQVATSELLGGVVWQVACHNKLHSAFHATCCRNCQCVSPVCRGSLIDNLLQSTLQPSRFSTGVVDNAILTCCGLSCPIHWALSTQWGRALDS